MCFVGLHCRWFGCSNYFILRFVDFASHLSDSLNWRKSNYGNPTVRIRSAAALELKT